MERKEIINYYIMRLTESHIKFGAEDIIVMLTHELYKDLPREVVRVIYNLLHYTHAEIYKYGWNSPYTEEFDINLMSGDGRLIGAELDTDGAKRIFKLDSQLFERYFLYLIDKLDQDEYYKTSYYVRGIYSEIQFYVPVGSSVNYIKELLSKEEELMQYEQGTMLDLGQIEEELYAQEQQWKGQQFLEHVTSFI